MCSDQSVGAQGILFLGGPHIGQIPDRMVISPNNLPIDHDIHPLTILRASSYSTFHSHDLHRPFFSSVAGSAASLLDLSLRVGRHPLGGVGHL